MYENLWTITGLLILGAYLSIYHYEHNDVIEFLSNKENIVLMGDSIFKNDIYVERGKSVGDLLQNKHGNVVVVAEDGATIEDLKYQFGKIPNYLDNKNTKLLISAGGNDILERYALSNVNNTNGVYSIFDKYKKYINFLKDNCDCELILCNIYYPKSKDYKRYYDLIEIWNDKLEGYADKNNFKVLNVDDTINKNSYFTHDIEPSVLGGKIITDNILSL